jgi:hypothetical protein
MHAKTGNGEIEGSEWTTKKKSKKQPELKVDGKLIYLHIYLIRTPRAFDPFL